MRSEELLPCPFCGGDRLHVDHFKNGGEAQITCLHCCAVAPNRERWNTRAERTCRYEHTDHCTRVCTSCGREVETFHLGYNYCPRCGAYIETDEENAMFRKVVRP